MEITESKVKVPRKCLQHAERRAIVGYGSLACPEKGVSKMETGNYEVTASLQIDRETYVVRGRIRNTDTGEVRQRSKSTGYKVKDVSRRKAEKIMRKIVSDWETEIYTVSPEREPTFSEYVEIWLTRKSQDARANTMKAYRDYARCHILPVLGNMKIREMRYKHIRRFYDQLQATHSVNSLKKYHVVVTGAFKEAIRDDIITENPAREIEFRQKEKFRGMAYTPEQAGQLYSAVIQEGEPIRAAVTLAMFYGLRMSEVRGLRWSDIDFAKNVMHIQNTVTENGDLLIESEQTKTAKSRRTIFLIPSTVPYLKELKAEQEQSGLVLDKVCVHPDGRRVRAEYLRDRLRGIMERSGLPPIRFHDLRHTTASLLATKASPKEVQDFLGHEDISTTMNIYTHLTDDTHENTSKIMDEFCMNFSVCSETVLKK